LSEEFGEEEDEDEEGAQTRFFVHHQRDKSKTENSEQRTEMNTHREMLRQK
jgi:hypothetical protein